MLTHLIKNKCTSLTATSSIVAYKIKQLAPYCIVSMRSVISSSTMSYRQRVSVNRSVNGLTGP